jgi:hypothetical protein
MGEGQLAVKEWLAKNQEDMVSCPNQPGNLMITKIACAKRYWMGRNEDYQDLMKGDVFNYSYKRGLSLCRECSIGKQMAREYKPAKLFSRPPARNGRPHQGWKINIQKSA